MSRGGKWRLAGAITRSAAAAAFGIALAWGGWMIVRALQQNPRTMPAAARAVPMKAPVLKSDGVLDRDGAWLARVLALPKDASLMELDLPRLQVRVLGEGQVLTASLTRHFPDTLVVQITERSPVARVMTEIGGVRHELLVARDGVVFAGTGHGADLLATLPWLDGVALKMKDGQFQRVAGMAVLNDLLAKAQLEAGHLYRTWHIVSLARLESDREIEVRTRTPLAAIVVFRAPGDFLGQLAKLNFLWEQSLAQPPAGTLRIDLSLGRQVPVMIEPAVDAPVRAAGARPAPARSFSLLSSAQPRI